jgi:hypothetical protein
VRFASPLDGAPASRYKMIIFDGGIQFVITVTDLSFPEIA